jgi:ubiquinone/menaquinone biosynthesis C-methylase UbiE
MPTEVERWKTLDAASYDDVADQFDLHSTRLSAGAAADLLRLAAVASGERVLDVGTGTGLLPFELLRTLPSAGPVVGIDISAGMIRTATAKAGQAGLPASRLRFERMDAESLDFPEASFDVVLSAFALTHVPHPEQALREILRVLRPGGRAVLAVGSRPPLVSPRTVAHAVAQLGRAAQSRVGRRLGADLLDRLIVERYGAAPADLPRGSELSVRLDRSALLRRLVREAGFVDVRRDWRNYQNEIETPELFWDIQRTIRSDARKRLLDAPAAMVDDVRTRFLDASRRTLDRGGRLTFPISAVFVAGRRPGDAPSAPDRAAGQPPITPR